MPTAADSWGDPPPPPTHPDYGWGRDGGASRGAPSRSGRGGGGGGRGGGGGGRSGGGRGGGGWPCGEAREGGRYGDRGRGGDRGGRGGGSSRVWRPDRARAHPPDLPKDLSDVDQHRASPNRHATTPRGHPADLIVGEVIYGASPVLAALSSGRRAIHAVYLMEGSDGRRRKDASTLDRIRRLAREAGVGEPEEMSKHALNLLSDGRPHQGVAADVGLLTPEPLDAPPSSLPSGVTGRPPLWVALDQVTDPQNLGALVRSAWFLGADGVAVCAKNSAPLSAVVSKASAGALEVAPLHSVSNMPRWLGQCAEAGWEVLGTDGGSDAIDVADAALTGPAMVVLGSEGNGMRPLVRRACTRLVRVPGREGGGERGEEGGVEGRAGRQDFSVDSLNVSVAAGIVLHSLLSRRGVR